MEERPMAAHVYKLVDLVGTSTESVTDAIQNAIARAFATIRYIRWFEVVQVRGDVVDGKVGHYQVTLRVGFTLEEEVASAEVVEIPAAAGV
jgi:flavin-binding protein dodecin